MKILWFTNIPMPAVNEHFSKDPQGTGGWMGALLEQLQDVPELKLGVVTTCSHYPDSSFSYRGVEYYIVQQKWARVRRRFFPVENDIRYVRRCATIAKCFQPNLIHIHGTENFFGEMLCQDLLPYPVVFSLQGLMVSCSEWNRFFGKIPIKQILRDNFLDTLKGRGLLLEYIQTKHQAKRERRYLQQAKYFFGRTSWDRATVNYYNDHFRYYQINRMLRKPFWQKKWQLSTCVRHRIIFTNARHPRKGTELLLDSVKRLQPFYPDMKLVLIGSLGYGRYRQQLERKIDALQGAVEILGPQNAEEITEELCKAHIFISASYIDNSPNSVAEAQLVGTPVIASYTGGVPSLVRDLETGLLFPTGDVPLLVDCITRLFKDDSLAEYLSKQACETAQKRHDPTAIIAAQVAAYKDIVAQTIG